MQSAQDHRVWRRRTPDDRYPHGEPFRCCGYCGSIHPEDLLTVLNTGARLGGSDWKYGYPHKFYVYDIPNPHANEPSVVGSQSVERDGMRVNESIIGRQGTFHSKWYNQHLLDEGYDEQALTFLLRVLQAASGIMFRITNGRLEYGAPFFGYQR